MMSGHYKWVKKYMNHKNQNIIIACNHGITVPTQLIFLVNNELLRCNEKFMWKISQNMVKMSQNFFEKLQIEHRICQILAFKFTHNTIFTPRRLNMKIIVFGFLLLNGGMYLLSCLIWEQWPINSFCVICIIY